MSLSYQFKCFRISEFIANFKLYDQFKLNQRNFRVLDDFKKWYFSLHIYMDIQLLLKSTVSLEDLRIVSIICLSEI